MLVNNAGKNAYADATRMTVEEWDSVFDVDLEGAWLMARAVLVGMTRSLAPTGASWSVDGGLGVRYA